MKLPVSLVFLNWKRPENLAKILDKQTAYDCVREAVVFNNSDVPFAHASPKSRVLNTCDFGVHARWSAGLLARSPVIIFQDDDLILPEITVLRLAESVQTDPNRVYGLMGRNFNGKYTIQHVDGECDIVLTTAAAMAPTVLAGIISAKARFESKGRRLPKNNGEDIFMSYATRHLTGKRPVSLCLPWSDLPAPHALSALPNHFHERSKLCQELQEFFKA